MKNIFDDFVQGKDILKDLYYGRLSGFERSPARSKEEMAVEQKIQAEKSYFADRLSADDYKRLEAFEALHADSHAFDEFDAFCFAFKLGVALMCAVFMGDARQLAKTDSRA